MLFLDQTKAPFTVSSKTSAWLILCELIRFLGMEFFHPHCVSYVTFAFEILNAERKVFPSLNRKNRFSLFGGDSVFVPNSLREEGIRSVAP